MKFSKYTTMYIIKSKTLCGKPSSNIDTVDLHNILCEMSYHHFAIKSALFDSDKAGSDHFNQECPPKLIQYKSVSLQM